MRTFRYSSVALLLIFLDQATKLWAYEKLRYGPDISVLDGFFKLSYAENPGIAFGMFSDSSGTMKVWLLTGVSVIAVFLVVYFAFKSAPGRRLPIISLMFVLGGIVGNLIDRVLLGAVIDFIDFYIGNHHWPTFNIADAAICVGAVLLSVDIIIEPKGSPEREINHEAHEDY